MHDAHSLRGVADAWPDHSTFFSAAAATLPAQHIESTSQEPHQFYSHSCFSSLPILQSHNQLFTGLRRRIMKLKGKLSIRDTPKPGQSAISDVTPRPPSLYTSPGHHLISSPCFPSPPSSPPFQFASTDVSRQDDHTEILRTSLVPLLFSFVG
jgi:hypothetical protein